MALKSVEPNTKGPDITTKLQKAATINEKRRSVSSPSLLQWFRSQPSAISIVASTTINYIDLASSSLIKMFNGTYQRPLPALSAIRQFSTPRNGNPAVYIAGSCSRCRI